MLAGARLIVLVLACWSACASMVLAQTELELLRQEVEDLRARLERMEAEAASSRPRVVEELLSSDETIDREAPERLVDATPGIERSTASTQAAVAKIEMGGALRFNYVYRDFSDASESRYGESGLDNFRLNVDGEIDKIRVSAEYRFYGYMHTLRYGWIGYQFNEANELQFGVHQVPFGLLPYAAHNSWFGVPYYVGLSDDYDMGLKYLRQNGGWSTQFAFYKNEELNDATDLSRYSFDLVRVGDDANEEVDRFVGRVAYQFGAGTGCETEVGLSAQTADIYNHELDRRGAHWAGALHLDNRCGRWNFQLQAISYDYDPPGPNSGSVRVGAFETSYPIADEAEIVVANIAYNLAPPWPAVQEIICYNNYSQLLKKGNALDSRINTLGCAIGSGPLFTYIDYILANNMAFFGGSMADGGVDEWRGRININIGFYW